MNNLRPKGDLNFRPCSGCDHQQEPRPIGPKDKSKESSKAKQEYLKVHKEIQMAEFVAKKSFETMKGRAPVSEKWCKKLSTITKEKQEYVLCSVANPETRNFCNEFEPRSGWEFSELEQTTSSSNTKVKKKRSHSEREADTDESFQEIIADGSVAIGISEAGEIFKFHGAGLTTAYGVFGQPGQGKSYFLMRTIQDLVRIHAFGEQVTYAGGVIFDPKGELADPTLNALRKARRGEDQFISLNPIDMEKHGTEVNLLDAPISDSDLGKLLAQVAFSVNPMKEQYFAGALALYLSALCQLHKIATDRRITLLEILEYSFLPLDALEANEDNALVNAALKSVERKKRSGLISTDVSYRLNSTIKYQIGILRNFFSPGTKTAVPLSLFQQVFSEFGAPDRWQYSVREPKQTNIYSRTINNGLILSVGTSADKAGLRRPLATLVKCIFQQLVLSRFAIEQTKHSRRPVFLLMDEYHTVASDLPQMGLGDNFFISQARQFGCFTMLVTQNLAQLKTSQLAENWEAGVSNMLAKVFFAVGDPDTARYASDLAGDREEHEEALALSEQVGGGGNITKSYNVKEKNIVPARTFSRGLARGEVILIGSGDGGRSRFSLEVTKIP